MIVSFLYFYWRYYEKIFSRLFGPIADVGQYVCGLGSI